MFHSSFQTQPSSTPFPSSLWERRRASKKSLDFHTSNHANPTSSRESPRSEVDMNVLSLVLEMPLLKLDSMTSPRAASPSPSSFSPAADTSRAVSPYAFDDRADRSAMTSAQALEHLEGSHRHLSLEIDTARTAVTSALSIFDTTDDVFMPSSAPAWPRTQPTSHLVLPGSFSPTGSSSTLSSWPTRRTSYAQSLPSALPSPTTPVSPAESTFTDSEHPDSALASDANVADASKRKGRARMSQEKRKRLARRREREALLAAAAMGLGPCSPTSPKAAGSPFSSPCTFPSHSPARSTYLANVGGVYSNSTDLTSRAPASTGGVRMHCSSSSRASTAGASSYWDAPSYTSNTAALPGAFGFMAAYDYALPSPALTSSGDSGSDSSLSTPQTSPCKQESPLHVHDKSHWNGAGELRPPRLVIEPPSPQRGIVASPLSASAIGARHGISMAKSLSYGGFELPSCREQEPARPAYLERGRSSFDDSKHGRSPQPAMQFQQQSRTSKYQPSYEEPAGFKLVW